MSPVTLNFSPGDRYFDHFDLAALENDDFYPDGSDLGGSLRNPASFCNVVGLRPSPGRVPDWPFADAGDQFAVVGPMGRTVGRGEPRKAELE